MHAVILAGGKGTRLRPYTTVVPKPLVPIGDDTSVLDVVLRQLSAYGFEKVTLAIGTHGHLIRSFVGDGGRWGLSISYAEEQVPLGTIGPLLLLLDRLPEQFLVMNGDVLTDLDYSAVLQHHMQSRAPLTVATCRRQSHIDFGVITSDECRIRAFHEKPVLTHEVSMGIYALSRPTLEGYEAGLPLGFDTLVLDLLSRGNRPATYQWDGYWLDIGRPEDYERANAEFAQIRSKLLPRASGHTRPGPVLVLGGLGFLGRHVVDALRRIAHVDVIVSGRVMLGHHRDAGAIELDLAGADVADLATTLRQLRPTAIVNCAGATAGPADRLHVANVKIPSNLIDAIARSGINARLVHLGSAAEYGAGRVGTPLDESAPLRPTSLYGTTKLAGSMIVLQAVGARQLDGTVLRIFNPVGPGSPPSSLVGRLVAEIQEAQVTGAPVRIGPLGGRRDFVDVRDAAEAVVQAVTTARPVAGVLNIARGEAVAVRALVGQLLRIAGYDGAVEVEEVPPDRSTAVDWQCADIGRADAELGWTPTRSLSESLRDLWDSRATR